MEVDATARPVLSPAEQRYRDSNHEARFMRAVRACHTSRVAVAFTPPLYHDLKMVCHMPLSVFSESLRLCAVLVYGRLLTWHVSVWCSGSRSGAASAVHKLYRRTVR